AYLTSFHYPKKTDIVIVGDGAFAEFVGNVMDGQAGTEEEKGESAEGGFALESVSESAPVINIINATCLEAVRKGASDIHIQPEEKDVRIRFRID
ncbi:hypothetical protein H0R96_13485, partial [Treponema socranskii]